MELPVDPQKLFYAVHESNIHHFIGGDSQKVEPKHGYLASPKMAEESPKETFALPEMPLVELPRTKAPQEVPSKQEVSTPQHESLPQEVPAKQHESMPQEVPAKQHESLPQEVPAMQEAPEKATEKVPIEMPPEPATSVASEAESSLSLSKVYLRGVPLDGENFNVHSHEQIKDLILNGVVKVGSKTIPMHTFAEKHGFDVSDLLCKI
jgi:hypothetical protein